MARIRAHNQHVNLYGGQGLLGEVRDNNRPNDGVRREVEKARPGKRQRRDLRRVGCQGKTLDQIALIKLQQRIVFFYARGEAQAVLLLFAEYRRVKEKTRMRLAPEVMALEKWAQYQAARQDGFSVPVLPPRKH